ncbi:MAG: hypothetical protein MHPSP_001457, partial [Paramarteilia canceri]
IYNIKNDSKELKEIIDEERMSRKGIKRPRNAFIIYSADVRAKLSKMYPLDTIGQISSR